MDQVMVRTLDNGESSRPRTMKMKNGVTLHYRRNRGDMQSIREIWLDQHYRLPGMVETKRTLVDLGGNIGMTTVWLANTYGFDEIVVVEPEPSNAELLQRNLDANNISAKVIRAAVGPTDGEVRFSAAGDSNQGRISDDGGQVVPMVSMDTVLKELGTSRIDLLKLDIEGGEQELVSANCEWMDHMSFVVTELHPDIIDVDQVVGAFETRGLQFHPGHGENATCESNFMDMFIRAR